MQGILDVFSSSNFEIAGQFSVAEFKDDLEFCGYELKEENQGFTFLKQIDAEGQQSDKGKGTYQFWVFKTSEFVVLSGKIFYDNKLLYEMPAFQKVVNL